MKTFKIKLSTINDVRDFVSAVTAYDGEADLSGGRYVVDAKSIMGIFSLDLSEPISLTVHSGDEASLEKLVERFIVR